MNVLVTGAAGHLGRELTRIAEVHGLTICGTSRRPAPSGSTAEWMRADLASGEGLAEAVSEVDVVIHAASDARQSDLVDVRGTQRLVDAARAEGVGHLVFISIIGIDKIGLQYYRDKLAAEDIIQQSGLPFSILRTAQFHYFVDLLLSQAARVPLLLPIPSGFWIQSISTTEVAEVLCRLAADEPQGFVPDLAGPQRMRVREAVEHWLDARDMRRLIVPLPVPGAVGASLRAGCNTTPGRTGGRETWAEWLSTKYRSGVTAA